MIMSTQRYSTGFQFLAVTLAGPSVAGLFLLMSLGWSRTLHGGRLSDEVLASRKLWAKWLLAVGYLIMYSQLIYADFIAR
jgi:hypothetical protein